jgi:hypothetical protein
MADTQNAIYAQAYGQNIIQLAQQKYSKLMNTVFLRPNVQGKTFFQDQIGQWEMSVKGGRNVQTPNNDPNLARRMGVMVDYHDNRLLDRGDELKCISDPRSAYTIAAAQSLGRRLDRSIIEYALGTSKSGETGATSVTLGNIVLATAAAPTVARVLAVKKIFDNADVEPEDRYFVVTPDFLNNMLNDEKIGSIDYNTVRALARGELKTWLSFNWIMSTQLAAVSASTLIGVAYQKYGICLAMADKPVVRTDERADLSYSWQVYYELNIGGVRLEESRVVVLNEG